MTERTPCPQPRRAAPTLAAILGVALPASQAFADPIVSDFEDVTTPAPVPTELGPEQYFFPRETTTFRSGAAVFGHTYFPSFDGSSEWTYSNVTDTTTPGFTNQYAAFTGTGANGSPNYAIANALSPAQVTLVDEATVLGGYVTNTTYTALTMQTGDAFSKAFGGASGDDPDYLLLTVTGFDAGGTQTGAVDFFLADYRFADNSNDYIVDRWTWVDLTPLGEVASLAFSMSGSDTGDFGLNTPAYFALDDLTVVPIPAPVWLLASTLAALGITRRRSAA